MIRPSDKKLIIDFEELVDVVKSTTSIDIYESAGDKRKRIDYLLSDFVAFCNYYFPEYCFAPFAWFHKDFSNIIVSQPCNIFLLQIFREGAKSTIFSLFLPMYELALGLLTGLILGSHDENMASQKLIDIQVNLEANQRFINDFGDLMSYGNWESGQFKTKTDIPFYAFGKRQSPRGFKFKWRRPNMGIVDDLNDSRQLKNDDIANEDKRWVMEELKPALWIKQWWLLILQNKFHDNTVTALIEDDEEIKKVVLRADMKDENGDSNWPENFTNDDIKKLEETEGAGFIRERMNTPFDEGTIFKLEWMHWCEPLAFDKYDGVLVNYLDPSYKSTEKSDYKFWVLVGKTNNEYHILRAWGERTSSKAMWENAFDTDEWVGEKQTIKHAMEGGFIQEDVHKKELERVEDDMDRRLRVAIDNRVKPDKFQRIETMQPLFQRGLVKFNIQEKDTAGMKLLRKQLLAIERGSKINDDGPDALEGAIWYIDRYGKKARNPARSGKFNNNSKRSMYGNK